MALGSFAEGTSHFEAALQAAPNHPAAQLGAAESLVAAAAAHARQGALGTAAAELARAVEHTLLCTARHGTLEAGGRMAEPAALVEVYAGRIVSVGGDWCWLMYFVKYRSRRS
jgi:thioredoxin-like negative regulator of GroEL